MTVFVQTLYQQLRRRGFAIGPAEYEAVRTALREGFGWSSSEDLRAVVVALWAGSRDEQTVVRTLFDQHVDVDWWRTDEPSPTPAATGETTDYPSPEPPAIPAGGDPAPPPQATSVGRLPALRSDRRPGVGRRHIFLSHHPVNQRAVAQAWRRLRWPVREGPRTELDVDATVRERIRSAVVTAPVLRPARVNRAEVLLLIDRLGSMAPFSAYVSEVCRTIGQAGRLGRVTTLYFHDSPVAGTDPALLDPLGGSLFPALDPILGDIPPLAPDAVMSDPSLTTPVSGQRTIAAQGARPAVVVISDGGAARGRYDLLRLLDTAAFLKGLRRRRARVAWLNPMPPDSWASTTAAAIARHVPMFPMTERGMHRAVDVLRGHPATVERPLR
ncbi:VWA domain-containing protein [Actinoplanes solisilvae]|uniref:VWA domain-containing protein n=1 Tax=Actinoplanes solisilvae TaxID=2486853 RepID=UPI0013E34663|nr:VWA domain-containing protein [Actinoplanes solisilvae]